MSGSSSHSQGADGPTWPSESALRAWWVDAVEPLPGGQGSAFRSGELVFKPAPERDRSAWLAEAIDGLAPSEDIRVARPVRSVDGAWVVDGWAAWHWLDGEPWAATVSELIDVSARFHDAVARVPRGRAIVGSDRWAVADRVAWGQVDDPIPGSLAQLASARRPVPLACQFIHGDLCGNVLAHTDLPPAVIDISPYWRPAAYATAIALVDHAVNSADSGGPDPDLLGPHGRQLLIRALLFRALSEAEPTDVYDSLIEGVLAQG